MLFLRAFWKWVYSKRNEFEFPFSEQGLYV